MSRGAFISFEGGEGAGKSTVLEAAARVLGALGIHHRLTREPGGTALGEALRALLLAPGSTAMCAQAETLLIFAARAQHVVETIEPALAAGQWVLCDRFTDASYAYQGAGRGVPQAQLAQLEAWAAFGLKPDRTYLLDVAVATGRARAASRGAPDRLETESDAFFERVRSAYLARAGAEPERFVVVDAGRPLVEVVAVIETDLARWARQRLAVP